MGSPSKCINCNAHAAGGDSGCTRMEIEMKPILDACCGSRMFWFDKTNPAAIFMDNRELDDTLCDGRVIFDGMVSWKDD